MTSLSPNELLSGLGFAIELLQTHGLEEVLEVRRLLLPPAAALAAQRVTPEQVDEMRKVVDRLETETDQDEIERLNRRFTALLGDATGNETLGSFLRALHMKGTHVRRAWLTADPIRRELGFEHQRMLLDAIRAGDSEMARSISTVQIDERQRFIDHLRTGTPDVANALEYPFLANER